MRDRTRTDSALLAFSVLAAAYFAFLALDSFFFRLEWIVLDVFRESLTIPLILAVAMGFVLSVLPLLTNRQSINTLNVGATLILLAVNCLNWGL